MRSFKLKVSVPRVCENATGEQTGRERREGEWDRDALGDRERCTWDGGQVTKKAFSQTSVCGRCTSAYVYIPEGGSFRTGGT